MQRIRTLQVWGNLLRRLLSIVHRGIAGGHPPTHCGAGGKIGIRRELGALTISLQHFDGLRAKIRHQIRIVGHGLVGPGRQWNSGRV